MADWKHFCLGRGPKERRGEIVWMKSNRGGGGVSNCCAVAKVIATLKVLYVEAVYPKIFY